MLRSGEVKKKLPADLTKELSDSNLLSLINAEFEPISISERSAVTAINSIMTEHIKMDELKDAKERYVSEMNSVNVDNGLKESIKALGRYAISANYFYDPILTKEKKSRGRFSSTCLYSSRTSSC